MLFAAGSGSQFNAETPKQFALLAGKPVIRHAAEALAAHISLLQPVGDAVPIDAALRRSCRVPANRRQWRNERDTSRARLEALVPHAPDIILVHEMRHDR